MYYISLNSLKIFKHILELPELLFKLYYRLFYCQKCYLCFQLLNLVSCGLFYILYTLHRFQKLSLYYKGIVFYLLPVFRTHIQIVIVLYWLSFMNRDGHKPLLTLFYHEALILGEYIKSLHMLRAFFLILLHDLALLLFILFPFKGFGNLYLKIL